MSVKNAVGDFNRPVQWIGKKEDASDKILFARKCSKYSLYKKCIFKHMALQVNDFILVQNVDTTTMGDVAKILNLYEIEDEYYADEHCRAIVQWYSRPVDLPRKILQNENADFILDFDCEVVEDSRFSNDISIESINDLCHLTTIEPKSTPCEEVSKAKHEMVKLNKKRMPCFVCRFRLDMQGGRNPILCPVNSPIEVRGSTPSRRASTFQRRVSICETIHEASPVSRITRRKSIVKSGDLTPNDKWKISPNRNIGDRRKSVNKNVVSPIKLVNVKVIERLTPDDVLHIMNDSDSDTENGSPNKKSKRLAYAKTNAVKKNLNASIGSHDGTADSDTLNYSIVRDAAVQDTKIKLRLSETQKKTPSRRSTLCTEDDLTDKTYTPSRRTTRKRSQCITETPQKSTPDIYETPKKTRLASASIATAIENLSTTPRRSILKTPTSQLKAQQQKNTPRRSVCLPSVVEEERTPRKDEPKTPRRKIAVDEPKTPKTPKSSNTTPSAKMRLIRSGALTPTIHSRDVPIRKGSNCLQMARERLHVSAVPTSLPCREKEFDDIYSFLQGKIVDECGGCMYVSGVPGTGKTATVTEVIRALKRSAADEDLPEFEYVDINGMRLTEPRQAYVHIYRQLTGKTVHWEQAYNLLEKRFTTPSPRRIQTVLLVDELDILCNRRQDVVYNLLNWPTLSAARLVVVTIANTMDLPERLLMGKITSRLGLTRLTFAPYSHKQLQEIVMARLAGIESFKSDAVQLVARKVAAVSGDARRALDICRRATEIAEETTKCDRKASAVVTMVHVQKSLAEMISSAKVQAIKCCSKMEQLFLEAVSNEVSRTGVEETTLLGVYAQLELIAGINDVVVPNVSRTLAICSKLSASRLLICEHSRQDLYQKILLNISTDDVHYALKLANEAL